MKLLKEELEISNELREFIENSQDLINENKFTELYRLVSRLGAESVGEFTEVLLEAGINPLAYLDYIPIDFLFNIKIKEFKIPNHIKSIGDNAFYGCDKLINVDIPNSVTSIGESAFSWCSGLTSISIPDSVNSIESWAFCDCSNLEKVNIPRSVTKIGERAFFGCASLKEIIIPEEITIIEDDAFGGCDKLTIKYNGTEKQWWRVTGHSYTGQKVEFLGK